MTERLTIAEIKARFDSQWVLVENPVTNEVQEFLNGVVRYHSPNQEEVHRTMKELRLRSVAVFYSGEFPKDIRYVL